VRFKSRGHAASFPIFSSGPLVKISSRRLALALLGLGVAHAAFAQDPFPSRPVRIIVNTAPGGLLDVTTRLLAQQMGEVLKQTVLVENRAGGDGLIGIRAVKAAAADGYTLLSTSGTAAYQMAVRQEPGYDLGRDFTGVGMLGRSPFIFVVDPTQPDHTLKEYMARAKANPGKLSYASAGVGTSTHFAAEIFLQQTGLKLMHVPYKGNGAAMPDVMAGRVNGIFEAFGSSGGRILAGQLRPLGVTGTSRLPALPNVPTFAEQGITGYSYYNWMTLAAPAGTPKDVVQKIAQALQAAAASKAVKDRFVNDGLEPMALSPDETHAFYLKEIALANKLATDLKLPKQ
jgi:tripartite-type tricarboxylate transporter receptor subunit TctC